MTDPFVGRLLVAAPGLRDPSFAQTVVLVLDHDEDGTFGVVVNRPLEVDVGEVLPQWQALATPPGRLFQGGPVGLDGAIGMVAMPEAGDLPGVDRVTGPFGLVDLDIATEALVGRLTNLRVFAGHAGWAGGQLEDEIGRGDWVVVDADEHDPFSASPETLWRQVLRRQGGVLALLSTAPVDPRLN